MVGNVWLQVRQHRTMQWWDSRGLYISATLNQGTVSYVGWIGMSAYDDSWDSAGQIIAMTQALALTLDSSQYSHPIVQAVLDPAEIDSMVDMISYEGCSILLMLSDVTGYHSDDTVSAGTEAASIPCVHSKSGSSPI